MLFTQYLSWPKPNDNFQKMVIESDSIHKFPTYDVTALPNTIVPRISHIITSSHIIFVLDANYQSFYDIIKKNILKQYCDITLVCVYTQAKAIPIKVIDICIENLRINTNLRSTLICSASGERSDMNKAFVHSFTFV